MAAAPADPRDPVPSVRIGRAVSEDFVIAQFLAGELASERFGLAIRTALTADGEQLTVVNRPDLRSPRQNDYRRRLLTILRGYETRTELFTGVPLGVRWHEAEVARAGLAAFRYISYSYWDELSGGSRLSTDAAANIRRGLEVFGVSNRRFLEAAQAVREGASFPPMLLVGTSPADLVVLEGHLRLTAFALAGEHAPGHLGVLIGLSPRMSSWSCF